MSLYFGLCVETRWRKRWGAWLGKWPGRGGLAGEGERQELWLSDSLDVGPCTREEVEQQRRAGVTRLSHCSQHLLQGQWVITASLCLACVRLRMWVEKSELHTWVNSITLNTLPAFPLSNSSLCCVVLLCVCTSCSCQVSYYHAFPLVNHRCPSQPCGRHQAVLSLTSPSQ